MSWIFEHQRSWRIALLIAMTVTFLGPWSYDRIYVPAKYECSPPNIRLYGDFCGIPLPGIQFVFWTISGFFSISSSLLAGEFTFSDRMRELLIVLLLLLPSLSIISTLLLILRGNKQNRQVFSIIAWVLSIGVGLFIGLTHNPKKFWALWGIWLYIVLAIIALFLEIIALRDERTKDE
jgi:hypothetical protein